jgi:hypothetical protein
MKLRYWYIVTVLGFCVCAVGIRFAIIAGQQPENRPEHRKLEFYAKHRYADLNKASDRQLEELFNDFSCIVHGREFMRNEKTGEFYKQFLVAVIEDAMQGDVVEGVFASFILEITPPEILLEAIAPELGPQGKLHGILERESNDARKRLERQSPEGYAGDPDFRHYASYLKKHNDVETSHYLIRHMFRTAPGEALHAMIYVQYLAVPYPPLRLPKRASVNAEIRPILYAEHIISDIIWHQQFRFEVAQEELDRAKGELSKLSQHKDWSVRLYVAEITQQHPELRVEDVTQRLQKDENELVRQAMSGEDPARPKPAPPQARPDAVKTPAEA